MACYSGKDLAKGLAVFKDSYRATEDFYRSSVKAVNELNSSGVAITKADFDIYVRDNFLSTITQDAERFRFRRKKTAQKLEKVQRELGIDGKYSVGKPGTHKVGKIGIDSQDKLQRIKDSYLANDPHMEGLSPGESIIVQNILDGRNYQDDGMLDDAIKSLTQIRETGKSDLEKAKEKSDLEQDNRNEILRDDFTDLTQAQKEMRDLATRMYQTGEGDLETLLDLAKDNGIKIKPEHYGGDIERVAGRILDRLSQSERPFFANSVLKSTVKLFGNAISLYGFHDMQSSIARVSRGGSDSTTDGIAKTLLYDTVKDAEGEIIGIKEQHINAMGNLLAEAYGIKTKTFEGSSAKLKEAVFFQELLTNHAIKSSTKFPTGYVDGNGRSIELSKGELMQLYIDRINPQASAAMDRNGLTEDKLDKLVNDTTYGLTDQDKAFALSLVTDFYPSMWKEENEVYKRLYHTNMPRTYNYSGQISYAGESIEDVHLSPDSLTNMSRTTEVLVNSKARTENKRPLDLNRNIFANAVQRLDNSAKFVGGAEAYVAASTALEASRQTLEHNYLLDHHRKIKSEIDGLLGLSKGNERIPRLVNVLKSNLTASVLTLKPYLALNQATSAITWTIEDSFWSGMGAKPEGLKGVKIAKLLYDNSAVLRDRYKGKNIIALDASIESSAYDNKTILEGKNTLQAGVDMLNKVGMIGITAGDSVGIMWLGRSFFVGEYKKNIAKGLSHEESIDKGVKAFTRKFTTTQQSFSRLDRSDLQNSAYGSLFTMFLTTPLQYGRQTVDAADPVMRALKGKNSKGSVGYNLGRIVIFHHLAGGMYWFVSKGILASVYGWDDDDTEEFFWATMRGPWITALFLIGDVIQDTVNWLEDQPFDQDVGSTNAFSTVNDIQTTWQALVTASLDTHKSAKDREKITRLKHKLFQNFGKLFGIGVPQMSNIYRGIDNVIDGTATIDDTMSAWGFSDYRIKRAKGEKPKGFRPSKDDPKGKTFGGGKKKGKSFGTSGGKKFGNNKKGKKIG